MPHARPTHPPLCRASVSAIPTAPPTSRPALLLCFRSDGEHEVHIPEALATAPSTPLLEKAAPQPAPLTSISRRPTLRADELHLVPIAEKDFPDPAVEANMGWYCGALYWNCLQLVDAYADDVFQSEYVSSVTGCGPATANTPCPWCRYPTSPKGVDTPPLRREVLSLAVQYLPATKSDVFFF